MTWHDEDPGGLNRYLRDLHGALRAQGVRSRVVVVGESGTGAPEGIFKVGGALPRRLLGIHALVRRQAFTGDVLHSHFALHAALPALVGRTRHLPLVTSFQGPWAAESRTEGDRSRARYVLRRQVERAVYRRSQVLVCLSASFAQLLVRDYGVAPWRTRVLPPGVDLDHFRPRDQVVSRTQVGVPTTGFVALAVRRLAERMGLDVLLEAWSRLPDGLLLLAGDGPIAAALAARARELGLGEDRVRFLGRVPDAELPALYAAADVSVVPTTDLEGFGLVVLESLAVGTPVVATDVGGLAEALPLLQADLLVPAGDPAALAARIAAARDGTQPLPTRQACRRFAEDYAWDKVATRFVELYEQARVGDDDACLSVVYLLSTAQPSGGELALIRTLEAIRDRVHAHVIVAEAGPVCDLLTAAGISWELLPLGAAGHARREHKRSPSQQLKLVADFLAHAVRVGRRLRQLKPDLVHSNSLKAGVYGGVAARLARRPLVWHVRDRLSPDYLPSSAARALRLAVNRLPRGVVANSETTMATLDLSATQASTVVPSPVVRPPGFVRTGASDRLRVVSVGRLTPWKGQHVLLRAFARAFPHGEAKLTLVGGSLFGEHEYADSLPVLAEDLGIAEHVIFLGHQADVWSLLSDADVLVHSAVLPEPHGNVVAEGLAAGLAVIAADAGGPRELVRDGETGLLTAPGDVDALAKALTSLADDPALRERLGKAAESSVDALSPDAVATRLLAFYDHVLAEG